jgi:hypothetical protein
MRGFQTRSPRPAGGFFDEYAAFQAHDAVGNVQRLRTVRDHECGAAQGEALNGC